MPSSLAAGIAQKFERVAKLFTVMKGAKLEAASGSTVQVDSGAAFIIIPQANPATCTKGQFNVDTAGKVWVCTATNTWTGVGTQT